MIENQRAYRVAEAIHGLLLRRRGALAEACRRAGVTKNYYLESLRRGSIDVAPLMIALEILDIHPVLFFEELFGGDVRELVKSWTAANE